MRKSHFENEIKLTSVINNQLKMINIDNRSEITKKIKFLCELLDISISDISELENNDYYYDDSLQSLNKNEISLRKRVLNRNNYFLTLKCKNNKKKSFGLSRKESERKASSDKEIMDIINNHEKVLKLIKKHINKDITCGNLECQLVIKNYRTLIPIKTQESTYKLCIDKYFIYSPKDQIYSEYKYEVEIEEDYDSNKIDNQIEKLHKAIITMFDYQDNFVSKYKSSLDWIKKPEHEMTRIFSIMIDIVEYSKKSSRMQKHSIQTLNKYLKKAIREILMVEERLLYIPTGDGIIVIFEKHPEKIPLICYQTQKYIEDENKNSFKEACFKFRIGIHAGDVFKYSDINESLNYAGDGINVVERITGIGGEWHILASKNFYEYIQNLGESCKEDFYYIGKYDVKHGETLEVYNVYNNEKNGGNMLTPPKKIAHI